MRVAAALLSTLLLTGVAAPAAGQPVSGDATEKLISMRFVRTDLRQILQRVAPELGERIIYDTGLAGRVTIAVPKPVTREEAWELLHAALALKGFAAAPVASGGFKIIPMPEASASDVWTLAAPAPEGESRIVTLLPLHNIPVQELRDILTPLLDPSTLAVPSVSGNSLILATTQRHLAAILRLAHELDVRPMRDLEIATLNERDAQFVADVLLEKYDEMRGDKPLVEVWVDERTNSVLYRAPEALLSEVRGVIDRLDQPIVGAGEIQVIPLRFAAAEDIARHLQALSADSGGVGPQEGGGLVGAQLNVVADPSTASLVVNASPDTLVRVRSIVRLLDRPPRQVVIDAVAIEWIYDESTEFKIVAASQNFSLPGNAIGSVQMTPTSFIGADQLPLDSLTLDVARGLNRFNVIAEAQGTESRTVMQPHTTAISGEEQTFFSGNEIPVASAAQTEGRGNPFSQRRAIERRDVGVELKVRPTIGDGFDTQLEVSLKIDALTPSLVAGSEDPTFSQREIHVVAQLAPGAAVVIGSFSKPVTMKSRLGIPVLMDLPVLGSLFAQTVETIRKSHILIAVQAQPITSSRDRLANSIRRRVAFERATAREDAIPEVSSGDFALRVSTERSRAAADALAQQLDSEMHPSNVLSWTEDADLPELYDVQLLGFASYEDAADEAYRLYGEGFRSDVLIVAGAGELLD